MSILEAVNTALLSWPRAVSAEVGVRVPTHCLYPSNSVVSAFIEGGAQTYIVHDGGGALDQIDSPHVRRANSLKLIGNAVRPYGLSVDSSGRIYSRRVSFEELSGAIVLVANASQLAAHQLLDRAKPAKRDLKLTLEGILDREFPGRWKKDERIPGASHKIHRFDYAANLRDDRKLLLDFVVPDASSINAALVAHLDVKQEAADNIEQRIVFDDTQPWSSSDISLLRVGARPVPLSNLEASLERLAA
jgi:hypothetical protein